MPSTTTTTTTDWKSLCAQKQASQHASTPEDWILTHSPEDYKQSVLDVPRSCGILTERELEITETDLEVLLERLRMGKWTSEEVTRGYYKRAVVAHQLTNCLTEIFVDRALERARYLDEQLRITRKPVGPLHGLPVSLKDQFTMKGLETVMGYVSGIGYVAKEDSVLVTILYKCGAVPFVRTNVPQTLMWGETYNHVFGRTLNPYNRTLTPGGSSGGEGTLLAMKGSPVGVGTDIGGSLRIPSAFCGLYTLRPSYSRLPYYGASNALLGQESILSVLGPMSTSLSSLKIFTKAILDEKPWKSDPMVIPMPWDDQAYCLKEHGGEEGKLCFAIMWDNGVVRPHPPLERAMRMLKSALEAEGHKVIDWESHRHLEIYKNAETIFVADGNEDYITHCAQSGEPLITTMIPSPDEHIHEYGNYHDEHVEHKPFVKHLVGGLKRMSAYQLWQLHEEKRHLRKSHLDHWERTVEKTGTGRPVDAIISPAVPYTAVPHGLNYDAFYTTLCNALDYTTSIFPVTHVDPAVDKPHQPHEFYNYEDELIFNLYDTNLYAGCPVGLQLIGRTLEEEAVIRMTEIVDEALGRWKKGKGLN